MDDKEIEVVMIQNKKELELLENGKKAMVTTTVSSIIPSNRYTKVKTVKCELLCPKDNRNEPVYFTMPNLPDEEIEGFYGMLNKQVDFLVKKNITEFQEIFYNIIAIFYDNYYYIKETRAFYSNKLFFTMDIIIDKIIPNENDCDSCFYIGTDQNMNELRLSCYNKRIIDLIGNKEGIKFNFFCLQINRCHYNILNVC